MAAEIGDIVTTGGHTGELIGLLDGQAVVRPFPIPEQAGWPGQPENFVAQEEVRVVKKHWEWQNSAARERAALEARALARNEAIRAEHYDRIARADREWDRGR